MHGLPGPQPGRPRPGRRWLVAVGVLALLVAAAALVQRVSDPGAPPARGAVSVEDTGARPDDGADDLAAFETAVRRAQAEDRPVLVPAGTFQLSDVLVLDGVTMRGAGRERTRLVSTSASAGSIELRGEGPGLSALEHEVPGASDRSHDPGEQNIRVEEARSFRIEGVHLVGARGGGILVRHSDGGEIRDSVVEDTLADGIHMTAGSTDVRVSDNAVRSTGDDGIAVVSYRRDGRTTTDILVQDNRVVGGEARGISVVGGERVRIERNEVVETASGGIYVASEREWDTYGVNEVSVADNRVVGAPTRTSNASVLVYSSEQLVDDISFSGNTVLGSPTTGFGSWLHPDEGGSVGDLSYHGNTVAESAGSLQSPTRLTAGTIETSDNVGF